MLNLMNVVVGQKISLRNGSVGVVTENMGDGIWLQMRMWSVPEGAFAHEDELVHCEEIAGLAE
jgi:hypothetical protein